jgi:hypothetical protein
MYPAFQSGIGLSAVVVQKLQFLNNSIKPVDFVFHVNSTKKKSPRLQMHANLPE